MSRFELPMTAAILLYEEEGHFVAHALDLEKFKRLTRAMV